MYMKIFLLKLFYLGWESENYLLCMQKDKNQENEMHTIYTILFFFTCFSFIYLL